MGYDFLLKCVMWIKSGYYIVYNPSTTLKSAAYKRERLQIKSGL